MIEGGAPHVLVVAVGSAGDMFPFLGLARGLMARGHRVTLLGPTAHAAMARAAGVPFHGLGTEADYLGYLDDPDLWHPQRGFRVLWRGVLAGLPLLDDYLRARPAGERHVVLAHPLALPAAAIARAARPGLRIVTPWLAPSNLRSVHDPLTIGPLPVPRWLPLAWRRAAWRAIDARLVDPVALPGLNAERAGHGLAPVDHLVAHLMTVPDASLTLFPPWFAPTPPDWPRPLTEGTFPLFDPLAAPADPAADPAADAALAAFLAAGPAPVVFTPGSGNRQAAAWFERALAAVRRLGVRAVFLTPHRAQVPASLPADVLWQPWVPLPRLLPHAAALVHHGGIGTTAEALRAGVPQGVVPLAYDQFDNGARLAALGVGAVLRGRATAAGLAEALARLLHSDAVRTACAAAARRVEADGRVDLAARVEALLGLDDRA